MGYKRREIRFPRVIEVWEYHDSRNRVPGETRRKRRKPTQEEARKQNQKARERKVRWMLREHFEEADALVLLTYRESDRPGSIEECSKDWEVCRRKLKRLYQKAGVEFKWISNIEVGSRGAWHIHVAIKDVPGLNKALQKYWGNKHGGLSIKPMWTEGEFSKLAAYLVKTPYTDKRLVASKMSHSRNLPVPEPQEKTYTRWKTFEQAAPRQIPKGWRVDKGSLEEGFTRMGYPFRRYDLYPIGEPGERKRQKMIMPGKITDLGE